MSKTNRMMTNYHVISLKKIVIILFLLLGLGAFALTADLASAVSKQTPAAASNTEFLSSNDSGDYVKAVIQPGEGEVEDGDAAESEGEAGEEDVTESGDTITIICKHSQAFEYLDIRMISYTTGRSTTIVRLKNGEGLDANGVWEYTFEPTALVGADQYWIFVYKYDSNEEVNSSGYLPLMRGPLIQADSDGSVKFLEYTKIKTNNAKVTKTITSTTKFKKKDMSDYLTLLFKKKQSSSTRSINSSAEQAYYKSVSDKIVNAQGVTTDYKKAKAIFTWVAKNFYYDKKHGSSGDGPAFDDPYENLCCQQNGSGNSYNAYSGKVAMQCDGYAGIYCALVRAQGIPCRIVCGKHTEPSASKNWSNNTGGNHCWNEVYVDGKWITVDSCSGSYSKYSKDDGENTYSFKKSPQVIYEYFDMTEQALTYSHYAEDIEGVWWTVKKVAKPSVKKSTSTKVKVSWTKVKYATKYQIQYSKKKTSEYKTIATVGNVSSKVVFGSKSFKCYYRVRGYTFQNGIRINGAWSEPAAFTIK